MLPQRVSSRQELAASSPPNAVASPPVAFDMASDLKQWIAPLLDTDLETIYNVLKRDFEENSMKDERKQWQDRIECKSTGFKIQYSHRRNVQLRHVSFDFYYTSTDISKRLTGCERSTTLVRLEWRREYAI